MHPVGPQNPGVYWVRRVLVIVVAVAVVIGLVWWFVGRGSGPDVDPVAQSVNSTPPQMTGVLATDTSTTSDVPSSTGSASGDAAMGMTAAGTTTGRTQPVDSASAGQHSSTPASSTAADAKKADSTAESSTTPSKAATVTPAASESEAKTATTSAAPTTTTSTSAAPTTATSAAASSAAASSTTTPTTTAPPKPSYDAHGNLICPASSIGITGLTYRGSTIVGAHPRLGMQVTNTGSKPCTQDVSGAAQVYTVYNKAGKRIWSTDDCFPGAGHESVRLGAGSSTSFVIMWAGTTSSPGCDTPRVTVETGKYTLVAQLGDLKSKPHAFTMRK